MWQYLKMAAENVNNGVNETVAPLITNQDNVISGEEEIRDIYVVSEELIVAPELVAEVAAESEEEEEEEEPEENWLEEVYDQNLELQNRVHELEEQAEERQAVVEQRDVTIQNCVTRYVMLEQNHALAEGKILKLKSENSNIKDQLKEETSERVRMKDAWVKAARRVDMVERDVRSKKAKIDDIHFSFWTAIGRTQHRVLNYPVQSGQSELDMDRRLMIQIMKREYDEAVEGGICPILKSIPTIVMTPNATPDKSKPGSSKENGCHDFPTSEEPK